MPDPMIIRPSKVTDIPAITAIYRHAVVHGTASFELVPPDEAEMAARREACLSGGYPFLVASSGPSVVGYAYVNAYRARPAYRSTVEDSVYVADGLQGQGIGKRLLVSLIDESTRRGFRQMIAVIGDTENRPSIQLHQSQGFTHAGVLQSVGWKHGRWLDTVLMQRPLGAGDTRSARHPP